MEKCTTCLEIKKMYHGKKCRECRMKYMKELFRKNNAKSCPICLVKHNFISNECSQKCKILNRHNIIDGCWIWNGKLSSSGYGVFQEKREGIKREFLAHRCSYEIFIGKIEKGMFVLHKCDKPACCRPEHLFLGTHSDNMQDMLKKGRENYPLGELAAASKLNSLQVNSIKNELREGATGISLANKYGISAATISKIKNLKSWKHLKV